LILPLQEDIPGKKISKKIVVTALTQKALQWVFLSFYLFNGFMIFLCFWFWLLHKLLVFYLQTHCQILNVVTLNTLEVKNHTLTMILVVAGTII
jgi:hypothetical protein